MSGKTKDKTPLSKAQVLDILASDYALDCAGANPDVLMQVPDPDSFARFGRLVMKMALGELDPARVPEPVMREVLDEIGIHVPADWKIRFRPRPKKTFAAFYPRADMAQAALCRFRQDGGDYQLPPQYAEWVGGSSTASKEEFYEFRVGDYTLNFCR
jgi:hypothetical protein